MVAATLRRMAEHLSNRQFTRALGHEFKEARKRAGLSRVAAAALLPYDLHARTWAAYEQGERQVSVARLLDMCQVLNVYLPDLMAWALQRTQLAQPGGASQVLQVDLRAVERAADADLDSVRAWARRRRAADPSTDVVGLPFAAVQELAIMLGFPSAELMRQLARFAPAA